MNKRMHDNVTPEAWVIFSGETDLRWLRVLRPGFRHCYVLLHDGRHWISVDPLAHVTDIRVHDIPPEFNLPLWLKDTGMTVVKATIARIPKPAPWMAFTCVEAVKRILGLHRIFILTPWQLYRHLLKHEGDFVWEA